MIRVCTEDDFFVDSIKHSGYCWICCTNQELELGWIGIRCSRCHSVYSIEDSMPRIVKMRRELLKLKRSEFAKLTGYAYATIKHYEFVECSMEYFDKTAEIIKERFNER